MAAPGPADCWQGVTLERSPEELAAIQASEAAEAEAARAEIVAMEEAEAAAERKKVEEQEELAARVARGE